MDDKRLERIEDKIDKVRDHLGSIDSTLAAQHVSLEDHIRRTALLEAELKPIKKHVDMVNGAMKFLAAIALILSILAAVKALA